jgi:hypothetical protein
LTFSSAPENGLGQTEKSMNSVHAPKASAGRVAAQFIVRSTGIGGLPPTSVCGDG